MCAKTTLVSQKTPVQLGQSGDDAVPVFALVPVTGIGAGVVIPLSAILSPSPGILPRFNPTEISATLNPFTHITLLQTANDTIIGKGEHMSPIETIARPRRNRISIPVPRGYGSYSFHVILVPLQESQPHPETTRGKKRRSFVEALLSCPKLDEGESLDISRDSTDFGRDVALFHNAAHLPIAYRQ